MVGYRECSCFIAGPSLFDSAALYMRGQRRSRYEANHSGTALKQRCVTDGSGCVPGHWRMGKYPCGEEPNFQQKSLIHSPDSQQPGNLNASLAHGIGFLRNRE